MKTLRTRNAGSEKIRTFEILLDVVKSKQLKQSVDSLSVYERWHFDILSLGRVLYILLSKEGGLSRLVYVTCFVHLIMYSSYLLQLNQPGFIFHPKSKKWIDFPINYDFYWLKL
jgi:hypothetical protein